ncbi:hypothetical protein [Alicycliphilus denitrificans]|uniref:hypothetical protein n=1 Tax=Alicycliphilus denitrificans TaxID=179636 RepID=UPI00384D79F9
MYHQGFLSRALACLLGVFVLAASAHEGHDDAPATAQAGAAPRFAAVSEQFELIGVIDGRRLSLFLDHAPDNSPVREARLELEVGGKPLAVTQVAEGQYQAELAQPLADGETPVTATVIAGADSDLLATDIDWHAPAAAAQAPAWGGKSILASAAAALLALAALWAWRSRRAASLRMGGAA